MVRLHTIVSGGQTGADQAGLRAARRLGLVTGGWAPHGYRTLAGPNLRLRDEFGLLEHASSAYPPRTAANVAAADATVRFARAFGSAGEVCTLRAILAGGKPYFDFSVGRDGVATPSPDALLLAFLEKHDVHVLNVAGNAEETALGIGAFVEEFLVRALRGHVRGAS